MRFDDWRARAPRKESLGPKVVAVIEPILALLGADDDASSWIVWGEDPGTRYLIFTISKAGLIQTNVRVNVPQEGPRASGKVVRWNRVQTGELAIEMVGGHHIIAFQLEGQLLRGSDAGADDIATFALEIFAAIDGRTHVPRPGRAGVKGRARKAGAGRAAAATKAKAGTTKAGATTKVGARGGRAAASSAAGGKGAESVRAPAPRSRST